MDAIKKRAIYTDYEKELLINLVKRRINVIECKETNQTTNIKKLQAWQEIADEFNSDVYSIFEKQKVHKQNVKVAKSEKKMAITTNENSILRMRNS